MNSFSLGAGFPVLLRSSPNVTAVSPAVPLPWDTDSSSLRWSIPRERRLRRCLATRSCPGRLFLRRFADARHEGTMWMRSCAVCKASLQKQQLCDTVRCQCGWEWKDQEQEPEREGVSAGSAGEQGKKAA